MKKKMGGAAHKPKARRDVNRSVTLFSHEHERVQEAAQRMGVDPAVFLRIAALQKCEELLGPEEKK